MYISRQLMDKLRLLFINHKNVKKYCCRYTDLPGQYLAGKRWVCKYLQYMEKEKRTGIRREVTGMRKREKGRGTGVHSAQVSCHRTRTVTGGTCPVEVTGSVRDAAMRERQHRALC